MNWITAATTTAQPYELPDMTLEQLMAHAVLLPKPPNDEDIPYAIFLSQENFNKLLMAKQLTAFDSSPTQQVVSVLYGLYVFIDNSVEYKVMTKKEYMQSITPLGFDTP